MTRSAIYAAYAMTGRSAPQIAHELGVTVHAVHQGCQREKQPSAKVRHQRYMGHIAVHTQVVHGEVYPRATIPLTALRAAGLQFKRRLSFRVEPGRIVFSAIPQTPKEQT